jgi:hypothetical protein
MSITFAFDMNECLKLEAGWAGLSVRIWVVMFEWVIHFRPFSRRPT